jgi:hypothetical protein
MLRSAGIDAVNVKFGLHWSGGSHGRRKGFKTSGEVVGVG